FRHLATPLRSDGRLVAQCGGAGNIGAVQAVLATVGDGWTGPWNFATPEETEIRLRAAGFTDVRAWSYPQPEPFADREAFDAFLRLAILGAHLDRLPADEHDGFVAAVADRLPD